MHEPGSFKFVKNDNWIAELPAAVREAVHSRMSIINVPAGSTVAAAGQKPTRMFQIMEGYIRVSGIHEDGKVALIALYIPGNCLGESALIANRPHNHTAVALVDSRVRVLPDRDFWDLYHLYRQIPEALCRKFVGAISRQIDSREASATFRLGRRIAMMFENLVEYCPGAACPDGCTIALPFTQCDIATLLDVTRQAVQREISQLRSSGIIDKREGVWVVTDRQGLSRYAA